MNRTVRWQVLNRDDYTCQYCGRSAPKVVLQVDHVWAKSQGGSDHISNLVTACSDCNQGKKHRDGTDGLVGKDWITSLRSEVDELQAIVSHLEEGRANQMLEYLMTTYASEHEMDAGDVLDWLMSEVAA